MAPQEETAVKLSPTRFTIRIPQSSLDALQTLVSLSPLPAPFYEGKNADTSFGITSDWMALAKSHWMHHFSWRAYEQELNKYPQFTVSVTNRDGRDYKLHYVHLHSISRTAIPLLLLHGWPGSFAEFYPLLPYLREDFHIVIPSLPGYCFSSPPPLDKDFGLDDCAHLMDALMRGLGYTAYMAQGGDLGYFICRLLGVRYPSCKAVHSNLLFLAPRSDLPSTDSLDAIDKAGLERGAGFRSSGAAYAYMHATRPGTVAHVVSSSPLALLAWVGEKFLTWTDTPHPEIPTIVNAVSLWWLTFTPATAIYPYRDIFVERREFWNQLLPGEELHLGNVALGFSAFPREITPCPEAWVRCTGDVRFFKRHGKGGHFPAMEQPERLAEDIKEFAKIVWVERGGTSTL